MNNGNNKSNHSRLFAIVGGAAFGYWLHGNRIENSKKSRVEIDDPETAEEVCEEISALLEEWEPQDTYENEEEFTQDLKEYLEENSEWEVEIFPNSPEGKPDILVGDALALELKVGLEKSQRDRLVGQCAGYSRLWVTWTIIFGAYESELGRLVDLLKDKGLEYIAVWEF